MKCTNIEALGHSELYWFISWRISFSLKDIRLGQGLECFWCPVNPRNGKAPETAFKCCVRRGGCTLSLREEWTRLQHQWGEAVVCCKSSLCPSRPSGHSQGGAYFSCNRAFSSWLWLRSWGWGSTQTGGCREYILPLERKEYTRVGVLSSCCFPTGWPANLH